MSGVFMEYSADIHKVVIGYSYVSGMCRVCIAYVSGMYRNFRQSRGGRGDRPMR